MTTAQTNTTGSAAVGARDPAVTGLSRDEVERFHTDGYVGPYTAVDPDEMASIRKQIEDEVLATTGPGGSPEQSRYLDRKVVFDLLTHPAILDRITALIGPDVVLWRSHIFNKPPGDPIEIPWHQDFKFWPIEPPLNVTAWIAIDEVTTENSCVQLIPGSHLDIIPHIDATEGQAFRMQADPAFIPTDRHINMELAPGQFFIFVERLLHHSHPNHSTKRRMGIAGRYTVPFVRVNHSKLFPDHKAILVRGRDVHAINRYTTPPAE